MNKWKLGQDSYHKLVVRFTDGNVRTLYSIDWLHIYSPQRYEELGLKRLRQCITRWGTKARLAEIYENIHGNNTGRLVERYTLGIKTQL